MGAAERRRRIEGAADVLPHLIATARKIFDHPLPQRVAVLSAWSGLSGIGGWTPEMVTRVDRELAKREMHQ